MATKDTSHPPAEVEAAEVIERAAGELRNILVAMAGRLEPDVLLIDILLPGIDGAALITSLRSHPQFARSRLIVVTALDEAQREPYRFALDGVPVVHKTALVNELPALLAQATAAQPA